MKLPIVSTGKLRESVYTSMYIFLSANFFNVGRHLYPVFASIYPHPPLTLKVGGITLLVMWESPVLSSVTMVERRRELIARVLIFVDGELWIRASSYGICSWKE